MIDETTPIVCFSTNDWSDIPSSKTHIMRYLGSRRTVLYIDTIGIRTPQLTRHHARRVLSKAWRMAHGLRHVDAHIYVWSPPAIPFHRIGLARRFNGWLLPLLIRRHMRRLGIEAPIVWSYLPNAVDLVESLPSSGRVYHCIDDYAAFDDTPSGVFSELETRMIRAADVTVVSARQLYARLAPRARHIRYIPHVVDVDFVLHAAEVAPASELDSLARPIAGFVGRIAEWVDLDLIRDCARRLPHWTFVLVGPSNVDLKPLLGLPNVRWTGRRPHEQVSAYIKAFDVCLVPFVLSELANSINPLKVYEYLAVGKPVVSVPLPEVEGLSDVVDIASGDDFAEAIVRAAESDSPARRLARRKAVSGRGWGAVADEILALVAAYAHT